MRASVLAFAAFVAATPALADPAAQPDPPGKIPVEAGDRYSERWQGRKHFLFDDTYTPPSQTDASSSAEPTACDEALRRSDGAVIVRRPEECDE